MGELKAEQWLDYAGEPRPCYPKSEADKVIAELKNKCQMHDFFWEGCGFDKLGFKNSIDVRDYCDELKAENESLKAKLETVNDLLKASRDMMDGAVVVDSQVSVMRERKLKRALWLLKTRYFGILMVYASDLARVANPSIIHKSSFLGNPTPRCMEEYQHEAELYDNARIKCLKKAEEYK